MAGALASVRIASGVGERPIDRSGADLHVHAQVLSLGAHELQAVRLRIEIDPRSRAAVERNGETRDPRRLAALRIDPVDLVRGRDAVELLIGGTQVDPDQRAGDPAHGDPRRRLGVIGREHEQRPALGQRDQRRGVARNSPRARAERAR
jgi:hypothetical protein